MSDEKAQATSKSLTIEEYLQRWKKLEVELKMRKSSEELLNDELHKLKIHCNELSVSVDGLKKKCSFQENEIRFIRNSNQELEAQLKKALEEKSGLSLQFKCYESENKTLREASTKLALEKCDLSRTIEELKAENGCHKMFATGLMNDQEKIRSMTAKVKENIEEVNNIHEAIRKKMDEIKDRESTTVERNIYMKELERVKSEKKNLENELIVYKSNCEEMEEMMKSSLVPIREAEFFFTMWSKTRKFLKDYMENHDGILKNLQMALEKEKLANNKLILLAEENKIKPEEKQLSDAETQTSVLEEASTDG